MTDDQAPSNAQPVGVEPTSVAVEGAPEAATESGIQGSAGSMPEVPAVEVVAEALVEGASSVAPVLPATHDASMPSESLAVRASASQRTAALRQEVSDLALTDEERRRGNAVRLQHREENLEQIMVLADKKAPITNDDVEKLLHCSDASASRYLMLLVKRGLLMKEGKGRGVKYRRA